MNKSKISIITNKIYKDNHIIKIKDLLLEGYSPLEINKKIPEVNIDYIMDVIDKFKPAKRWAVLNGHYQILETVESVLHEFDKPDFEYLKELSRKLIKEGESYARHSHFG